MNRRFALRALLLCVCVASLAAEPKRDRFGDPLPEGAIARLGSLRLRNEQPIFTATFTPDGKTLAGCDADSISFWDPATGKVTKRVAMKKPALGRMRRLSGDGKTLVLSGLDDALHFVDPSTGEERSAIKHAQQGFIQRMDVSQDGKVVAAVHRNAIVLWDVPGGKILHEFKGAPFLPTSSPGLIALTADGKQLVLTHADSSLHLMDVAGGKELHAFEMPPLPRGMPASQRLQSLAVSPDGRWLAYAGPSTPLTVCELATGKRLHQLAPSQGIVPGMVFSPNGRFLVVDEYSDIRLFGVLSGKEIRKLPTSSGHGNWLAFSPDGRTLAGSRGGHTIQLWDMVEGRQPLPIEGHDTAVQALAFYPDGKRLVSADYNHGMIVWDCDSGKLRAEHRNNNMLVSLYVDADGERVLFGGSDMAVHRWDLRTGREESQRVVANLSTNQLALSPDGLSMAVHMVGVSRQLRLYNVKKNTSIVLPGLPNQSYIPQMLFTPDSRRFAAITSDGTLRLWDRDTGKMVRELPPTTPGRRSMYPSFAADGRSLAFFDSAVHIREIASGSDRLQIPLPAPLAALAYSPDARFLACGRTDGNIHVYSVASGKELAHWQSKQGSVRALAFRRDGRRLASGGADGSILLWNVPTSEAAPVALKAAQAAAFWQALGEDDAAVANRALAGLAAAPEQAVAVIKERLPKTWSKVDAKRLSRLITDLDDDSFPVRERATRELAILGPDAADALRQALAKDPSAEAKRRIEDLLGRLKKGGDPQRLRLLRAVEVLERIGTSPARKLLRELAAQPLPAELHAEVEAGLRRLENRRSAAPEKSSLP